jgi:acyl-CoA synthetase (AMP-forming)/AMP-acid ligase II
MTFVDIIRSRASEDGSRIAYTFTCDGQVQELDYAGLECRSRAIALRLREIARPGDRMLIMCAPGIDFVVAFAAALYGGIIAVPVYPPTNGRSVSRLLGVVRDAEPVALIADAPVLALLAMHAQDQLAGLTILAMEDFPRDNTEDLDRLPTASDVAFLQYTSGSTGAPKGVVVTQGNLTHNSAVISARMGLSRSSVCVSWLPPYHDMGLVGGILQPLFGGFHGVLMTPLEFLQYPLRWLEAVSRYGGTVSGGPDFAFDLCVTRFKPEAGPELDLRSWSVAFSGSEPIKSRTLERFAEHFRPAGFRRGALYPCYGLAETTLFVSGGPAGDDPVIMRTDAESLERGVVAPSESGELNLVGCGGIHPELDVRIVDRDTLDPLPAGRVGEILVAGASVAKGYWNGSGYELFHAKVPGSDAEYLRTGDLGFLWEGQLFVTGRIKDVLIIRGRNHYPQDIEDSVERCHPLVRPRGVAAFTIDDQLVVAAEIAEPHEPDQVDALTAAIRQVVAEEHGLHVHTVAPVVARSVPKASNGKLQRGQCRQLFLSGALPLVSGGSR